MVVLLMAAMAILAGSWVAIEPLRSVKITVFQPFRLATAARGLAIVLLSGRVVRLWRRGDPAGRVRAALIVAGLSGDWSMVIAGGVEIAVSFAGRFDRRAEPAVLGLALVAGLIFLARHDTESGHVRLIAATGAGLASSIIRIPLARFEPSRRRLAVLTLAAWIVPVLAAAWPNSGLAGHCRFGETPTDDVERLAVWCREHTPRSARFVTPPGPKTFRLWSRREVAFNRAASPYHASGLADWARRFRDHVGFEGTLAGFATAYLQDRQALEHRFDSMTDAEKAGLARRQGAEFVLAARPQDGTSANGPLRCLRVSGRYAIYELRSGSVAGKTGTIRR